MAHSSYLGIDQTGSVDSKGRPKALPCCLLRNREVRFFKLKRLSLDELKTCLSLLEIERLHIGIDCVLGLPNELGLSLSEAIRLIPNDSKFGRPVAKLFFDQISNQRALYREIDRIVGAQSVFQEKPFQRNIQTGTYRIWKELSLSPLDFFVPAVGLAKCKSQIPLFEGYPTLYWKLFLQSRTRQPKQISNLIRSQAVDVEWTEPHQELINKDPNFADAFMLALAAQKFASSELKRKPSIEGSIMGVMYE